MAVARAVCSMQGISGLLATRLRWRDPRDFREFLQAQRDHTQRRDELIDQELARLHRVLADGGICFIPLKGSALRALRLHQPGERPQGDIDLLLHADDLSACGQHLKAIGYELLYSSRRHDVYVSTGRTAQFHFGEHPENPLKLELHTRITEELPVETVDITASICPVFDAPGAGSYSSVAALMRHLCLHAAGCMRSNAGRFLQILDIALLARRLAPADWRELLEKARLAHAPGGCFRRCAWQHATSTTACQRPARGAASPLPAPAARALRTPSIYEVSWSNLRIQHCPATNGHVPRATSCASRAAGCGRARWLAKSWRRKPGWPSRI